MQFVSGVEGHPASGSAPRRRAPAPGSRFFSTPCRRLPAPGSRFLSTPCRGLPALGSWRSRTVLGAYRSLLGPYRSRSPLGPGRSRAALDPSRSPFALDPSGSSSALDLKRPRAALDPSRTPSALDPSRPPAALDPSRPRTALDPSRPPAALDPSRPPAALDPSRPPSALDPSRPRSSLDPRRPHASLYLNQSRSPLAPCPPLPALRRRVPVPRAGHAVGGERDRGLVEGPLHHGSVGARGEGHDVGVGRAVAAQRRLGVQGRFDAVAVPMPQCRRAPPFLGAGEGEPGRPGSSLAEEQIRRGAPYDLRGSVAQQSSSALAPPCDHAVQTEGDRRDIG
ncbi:DUF4573 domain-containing protein [Streptomyces canus]|uniref:DUF4573 domain-containing protein n=1 Tax=Streptomyces canus TaxID=58343 RepID=UPI00371F3613